MVIYHNVCRAGCVSIQKLPFQVNYDLAIIMPLDEEVLYTTVMGTQLLKKGEIEILNVKDPVKIETIGDRGRIAFVSFDRTFTDTIFDQMEFNIYNCSNTNFFGAKACPEDLGKLKKMFVDFMTACIGESDITAIEAGAKSMVDIICLRFNIVDEIFNTKSRKDDYNGKERFRKINEYIFTHISEKIALSDLAAHTYLSTPYLSREFSAKMEQTYSNIINLYRTLNAGIQLLETDDSLTYIANNSGFSSTKYYHTYFEKYYGCPPAKFRSNNKNKEMQIEEEELQASELQRFLTAEESISSIFNRHIVDFEEEDSFEQIEIMNDSDERKGYVIKMVLGPKEKIILKKEKL